MNLPRITAEQLRAHPDQTANLINRIIDAINDHEKRLGKLE